LKFLLICLVALTLHSRVLCSDDEFDEDHVEDVPEATNESEDDDGKAKEKVVREKVSL